ncbi:MAG: glycosyltransferase family 4 protein [Acidiferrobacterales bacterium]
MSPHPSAVPDCPDLPGAKIGIALHAFRPGGGIERYAIDLVRALGVIGITPHIYANRIDRQLPEAAMIRPHVLGSSLVPRRLKPYYLSARLRQVHARDQLSCLIGCCRNRASDLAICGGTHIGFLQHTGKRVGIMDRMELGLERDFYAYSRAVVAHSRLMQTELEQLYGIASSKIHVIYPPVSSERFFSAEPAERQSLRERLGFPKDEILFLFVSTGHKRKGFELLQEYFENARTHVRLLVAGRPVTSTGSRITYIGYRNDLGDVYRAVDFTIHPSFYEPFGLACVESVKCGTPIIISDRVGAGEIIADNAKVVLPTLDSRGLAQAIDDACQRRAALASQARSEAIQYNQDPVPHVQELLGLCRSMHATSSPGG